MSRTGWYLLAAAIAGWWAVVILHPAWILDPMWTLALEWAV